MSTGGDIIRVLRIYEFVGERAAVEQQIVRSVHGSRSYGDGKGSLGKVIITAVTLPEFPEIVEGRQKFVQQMLSETSEQLAAKHQELEEMKSAVESLKEQIRYFESRNTDAGT